MRILGLVLGLGILLGAASIIQNARHAIRAEGESFAMFAVNLLESVLMSQQNRNITRAEFEPYLDAVGQLRHVSVTVFPPGGEPIMQPGPPVDDDSDNHEVPDWFHWALTWQQGDFFRGIINGGPRIGRIVVVADPTDEIAEVWEDVRPLIIVSACLLAVVGLLLYRAVGHGLEPLRGLGDGFERLQRLDFPVKVDENVVEELHSIHKKFNWLANKLQVTVQDNLALAAHMVDLREEERLALARELHDELAPYLFGIKMQLAAVARSAEVTARPDLRQKLATVTGLSADLERVVRRMLHRLRPSTIDDLGLCGSLTDLIEGWRERHAPAPCALDLDPEMDQLEDTTRVTIYRAVQECLTNIAKHALRVRQVSVTLARHVEARSGEPQVELVVADDGERYPRTGNLGFGLLGMQERVRSLGGTMAIDHPGEAGFVVRIRLPFDRASNRQPPTE